MLIDNVNELRNLSGILAEYLRDLDYFVRLYAGLDMSLNNIQELVGITRDCLEHLELQLNMLSLGHLSPSVITPGDFQRTLRNVKAH